MAFASLSALVSMGVTLSINRALQRDFAAEWADSLRVKHAEALGEDAIAKMLEKRQELE
jgi:putative membrane protein